MLSLSLADRNLGTLNETPLISSLNEEKRESLKVLNALGLSLTALFDSPSELVQLKIKYIYLISNAKIYPSV